MHNSNVAIFAFQQHEMYQLKNEDFEMAFSSEETILFDVAFEEALVEEVRSYRCFWDPISRGFKDTSVKNNAFKAIGEKYGGTGWYKVDYSFACPLYSHNFMNLLRPVQLKRMNRFA